MLSSNREYQYMEASETVWDAAAVPEVEVPAEKLTRFHGQFTDCMEMYADVHTVAEYLNAHQGWFCRCAQPMTVEPLGTNGYALTVGRFGAFNYEVEPKVGLELLPPESGAYRIRTIAIPNYVAPGYDVDFKAVMNLVDASTNSHYNGVVTGVEWELDLSVYLHFPKFIQRLPQSVIQATGDRLLNQIVRQVSRRLTHKVQEDFHTSFNLTFPKKSKRRHC
ncbi:hypothetical protein C7Y66_13980 [Chroococcidiopsis sp. CCALA 051]|uniref:DUF1997 domain-containing protein n=1 Tax=Chroococcidiopsis sp. CCALA 051 TaxID=869949 RepID=UPI000D0D7588|nr:DUF1997 domain-containing protein [Chroococcidiopsis sp. CCALA 051]PSM48569.1 hypothetical protein C7Y66_13980 [Chroococcidiopsis sp. CCALA 051]